MKLVPLPQVMVPEAMVEDLVNLVKSKVVLYIVRETGTENRDVLDARIAMLSRSQSGDPVLDLSLEAVEAEIAESNSQPEAKE